jgi:hypothetical protein
VTLLTPWIPLSASSEIFHMAGSLTTYSLHSHLNWMTLLTIVILRDLVGYGFGTELEFGYRK